MLLILTFSHSKQLYMHLMQQNCIDFYIYCCNNTIYIQQCCNRWRFSFFFLLLFYIKAQREKAIICIIFCVSIYKYFFKTPWCWHLDLLRIDFVLKRRNSEGRLSVNQGVNNKNTRINVKNLLFESFWLQRM